MFIFSKYLFFECITNLNYETIKIDKKIKKKQKQFKIINYKEKQGYYNLKKKFKPFFCRKTFF